MKATVSTLVPSALEAHLGFWLRIVSNQVSSRFEALLETQGCSVTDWVALRTLFDRREASHAELIQGLGMTKGATSKVVSRLEAKGLVKRQLVKGSAREQQLTLTAKGRDLVPRLAASADENEIHFFGHLAVHEREALMEVFQSLVTHHGLQRPPLE